MKTKLTLFFILSLLFCIALPAVLLSNPTSSAGGQLRDIQGIRDKVLLLESGFDWLKWSFVFSLPALLTVMGVCFTALFFAIRDTRQDIQKLESNTRQDIQRLESGIKENRKLLIELIQKQTETKTNRQATSKAKRRQGKKAS